MVREYSRSFIDHLTPLRLTCLYNLGCPFSTKSQEEITALMAQIPKDHPTLNMTGTTIYRPQLRNHLLIQFMCCVELPSCEEGVVLVKMLNRFLDKSQLSQLLNIQPEEEVKKAIEKEEEKEPEYLEDPQLASAMREGTKVVHRAAETSVFTR